MSTPSGQCVRGQQDRNCPNRRPKGWSNQYLGHLRKFTSLGFVVLEGLAIQMNQIGTKYVLRHLWALGPNRFHVSDRLHCVASREVEMRPDIATIIDPPRLPLLPEQVHRPAIKFLVPL